MKNLSCLLLLSVSILFISCTGKLTNTVANELLLKAYTEGNDSERNGSAYTIIEVITIDSIHQQSSSATVFYHVSGRVENGSKYPKEITHDGQETEFKKGLFGWKLK